MTLVAALRCPDGCVVCADSQETVGQYRVSVQKIEPFEAGAFQVAIAGSGENGDLIDDFVQRIRDTLGTSTISTLTEFKALVQSEIHEFLDVEVAAYTKQEKRMSFIVCARTHGPPPKYEVWKLSARRLKPVSEYALVGWDIEIYKHEVKRFYNASLPMQQVVLLALRLLSLAKRTSNLVGGATRMVICKDSGLWTENETWIKSLEDRVAIFDSQLHRLFLACPDLSISRIQFFNVLQDIDRSLIHLREEYLEETARYMIGLMSDPSYRGHPYLTMPVGSKITLRGDGRMGIEAPSPEEQALLRSIHEAVSKELEQQDPQPTTTDPSRPPPSPESPGGSDES